MQHAKQSAGWGLMILGNVPLWLGQHGFEVLGAASVIFGMWCQWEMLRLRRREVERRNGPY
jgi:hypothetical protein